MAALSVLSRGTCHYGSKVETACKINKSKCLHNGKKDNTNHSVSEILSFVGLLYKFATTCLGRYSDASNSDRKHLSIRTVRCHGKLQSDRFYKILYSKRGLVDYTRRRTQTPSLSCGQVASSSNNVFKLIK
jgi:hypothetical protein